MCSTGSIGASGGGGMVAGASGAPPTKVAGAAGGPPTKVAGESGGPAKDATLAGGAADAAKGADSVAGGGAAPGSLAAVLEGLSAAVKALAEIVTKMKSGATGGGGAMKGCDMGGGTHVMGVQGGAASKDQVVARAAARAPIANAANAEDDAFEKRVLELINDERAKAGLGKVSYNATLDNSAEKHATHMSQVGKMAHDGIGDGDPGSRARAEGWRNAWGENVATGQTSPEQVVREWMASPTHRKNIMDPSFRSMGVGYVTAANGRSYWAQEFGA